MSSSLIDVLKEVESDQKPVAVATARVHLSYLDGIRGLAALYVVAYHAWQFCIGHNDPHWIHYVSFLKFGPVAVNVFIVLSGYCLMLPVVRAESDTIPRGNSTFFLRRAKRILPPYFAALVISILLLYSIPTMGSAFTGIYALYNGSDYGKAILTHLLLVHNFWNSLAFRIDAPMWSVATEWQIYLLFPFVLLPLRKRLGIIAPVAMGVVIGVCSLMLGNYSARFWYIASFALGMGAAEVTFVRKWLALRTKRTPYVLVAWALFVVGGGVLLHNQYSGYCWLTSDMMFSVSFAICLAVLSGSMVETRWESRSRQVIQSFLAHPVMVWLGSFSYSLYLLHYPLLLCAVVELLKLKLQGGQLFLIMFAVGVPATLIISYLFHLVFERPFLNAR